MAGESDDGQTGRRGAEAREATFARHYNARVRIDSSAPTRIDLAGGTFDIWPLYLFHERAQTINAAISLRAHCTLTSRHDDRVTLTSDDTGERVDAASPDALGVDTPAARRAARAALRRARRRRADAVGVAGRRRHRGIVGDERRDRGARWPRGPAAASSRTSCSTLAMNVEAQVIGVPTGVQDYRPALYGGVSAVELGVAGVRRVALDVDARRT